MQIQNSYKVHLNNGELSDPLLDRKNRGLTLLRLKFTSTIQSIQEILVT